MLRIRHLELRAETSGPLCGADFSFAPGLNLLRADNSSGKSTCLQSIIYALGLEGMLSPRREVPLPHVMTDSLEADGTYYSIIASTVRLEIANDRGEVVTVERSAAGNESDRNLIKTIAGPVLSEGKAKGQRRDFFVRRPGAAQREAGFHHWLARFLGWTLPRVTKTDGTESPLYLECIFPYFFVEQKHGWIGLQARIPSYFGIRDVVRRSAEFVLDLDAYSLVLERQRIESAAAQIENEWKALATRARSVAAEAGALVRNIPDKPPGDSDRFEYELVIATRDGWLTVDDEIDRLRSQLEAIQSEPVPAVGVAATELQSDLEAAFSELTITTAALTEAQAELDQARSRAGSLETRVTALEEDLQRHKDAALLRRLGSRHTSLLQQEAHCPTCQQHLPDGFDITLNPMTEADSISFIEDELRAYRKMAADTDRIISVATARVQALRSEANMVRQRIRSIKDTLTRPSAMPSVAEVAQRLQLEERIGTLEKTCSELETVRQSLRDVASRWARNRARRRELGTDRLSLDDRTKISYLNRAFVGRLRGYGVTSLAPSEVEVSDQTYRPAREGFDLGFDLSASDMIRMIWAYLVSLTSTAVEFDTNHARLLVMDEPRQQEVHRSSLSAFLQDLSRHQDTQIIIATSEEPASLSEMLSAVPHRMISVLPGHKILRPLG